MFDIIYRFDPHAPLDPSQVGSSDDALARLEAGNLRYAEMVRRLRQSVETPGSQESLVIPINPMASGVPIFSAMAPNHEPFALVLGCSDARVPVEQLFDCSANDLFVVRVAGNVLGLECLGSVDYAACHLQESLQCVLVLAHTECGAVKAAVDVYLSPPDLGSIAFSHAVRSLIDRVLFAVRGAARAIETRFGTEIHRHPQFREKLIEVAVFVNAAVTAWDSQREVTAVASRPLPVWYGIYDVARATVAAEPQGADTATPSPMFAPAPRTAECFSQVAARLVDGLKFDLGMHLQPTT